MSAPINPDEAPEAARPSPPLKLYFQVVENDAPNAYDGGRLVLKVVRAGVDPDLIDGSIVLSSRTDAFLTRFPWKTRAAKEQRYYRLRLEEVSIADLPPDPAAEAEIQELERRLAAARSEGLRTGAENGS